jgi:ketosteroid isomerase-like protein
MNTSELQRWLDAYVDAWRTYDPEKIAGLFTEDARYRFNPFQKEGIVGRHAIVANWLESRDPAGSWSAEYHALAVDGDIGIAEGRTRYRADRPTSKGTERVYANLWVMRFASDGRCRDFTEWFMEQTKKSS